MCVLSPRGARAAILVSSTTWAPEHVEALGVEVSVLLVEPPFVYAGYEMAVPAGTPRQPVGVSVGCVRATDTSTGASLNFQQSDALPFAHTHKVNAIAASPSTFWAFPRASCLSASPWRSWPWWSSFLSLPSGC